MRVCSVEGCNKEVKTKNLCSKHYYRLYNYGSPTARATRDSNEFADCGDYWEIKLYDRKCNHIASAKIDPEDVERCKQYKWHFHSNYVMSNSGSGSDPISLHRFVLGLTNPLIEGDHIYGDTLDNRKSQLRRCNKTQQMWNRKIPSNNTSGIKNVSWNKRYKKWHVHISAYGIKYQEFFDNFEEACEYADKLRARLHKEFARKE